MTMRLKLGLRIGAIRRPAAASVLLLLAILIAACADVGDRADLDAQEAKTSPSAAAINAAASRAAGEAADDGDSDVAAAEVAAPSGASPVKAAQVNRRVEVPDDLRVNWLIPWDGILPIYKPEFAPASEAPLVDDELIIGVAWDGEAKAYPISVLRSREMVNDELAGIPTLVTW